MSHTAVHDSLTAEQSLSFYTPACVFDIKLRNSTGQFKVHKIKEKKEMRKKVGGGGKKAGNERPVIVDVKPMSFSPRILTSTHPQTKTLMLILPTPAGGAHRGRAVTQ